MPNKYKVEDCLWYCDECNDCLDFQDGFSYDCGEWTCTKCGHVNEISEDAIVGDDEFDEVMEKYYGDDVYEEDEDDEESEDF